VYVATHPQVLADMRHTSLIRRSNSGWEDERKSLSLLFLRESELS